MLMTWPPEMVKTGKRPLAGYAMATRRPPHSPRPGSHCDSLASNRCSHTYLLQLAVTARLGRYNRPNTLLLQHFKSPAGQFPCISGGLSPFAIRQLLKADTIGICPPEYLDPDQVFSIQQHAANAPESPMHCPAGVARSERAVAGASANARFVSIG